MPAAERPAVAIVLHDCGSDADAELATLVRRAVALEAAGVTAVVVRDTRDTPGDAGRSSGFEPFSLLAALARATTTIGLIAAAPASTGLPYPVARRTATLDHLSHGRAGWAADFPPTGPAAGIAAEFVGIVADLWDSTADDAVVADRHSGVYLRRGRRRPIDHRGPAFRVAGPLNLSRPPQGHPVVVVDGGSRASLAVAARHADIVTVAAARREEVVLARHAIDAAAISAGRPGGAVRVWLRAGKTVAGSGAASSCAPLDAAVSWASEGVVDGILVEVDDDAALPLTSLLGPAPGTPATLRARLGLPRPDDGFGGPTRSRPE